MIKNYLRSSLRTIKRYPFISFINIFGLTVGLTCCLLIVAYVVGERSYDRYNKNADDIYRVTRIFYTSQGVENLHLSAIAPPFGPLLQTAFPDIKEVTRVLCIPSGNTPLKYKDKLFNENNTSYADEHFFDFFSRPVVKGDPGSALKDPYSVMLTEAIAKKYFGDEDPINKTIIVDNKWLPSNRSKHEFRVTGIFKSFPANSHMHPEILLSFSTLKDPAFLGEEDLKNDYGENAFFTYLLFPKNYNVARVEAQLPSFLDQYVHPEGMPGNVKTHQTTKLELQKLTDIHLQSHLADEIEENGNIGRVYIFSGIALFLLLIACINYMNLSTARSVLRAKEIGIRKVVGAQRREIIFQFLSESVIITYISLLFAVVLTVVLLPVVNNLSGLQLNVKSLLAWQILLPVVLLPCMVGLISGVYPALFMSSFIPVKVLKGLFKVQTGTFSFRKALVVFQFSVSIVLIVATAVVFKQLKYIQNKDLGIDKDHVLTMQYDGALDGSFSAFKADLLSNPDIENVGRSSRIPSGRLLDFQGAAVSEGGTFQPLKAVLNEIGVDDGFIPAFGIKMAAGRNFSDAIKTDSNKYIINETAVKTLGWETPEKTLNKQIKYGDLTGNIIGVMKDFHFESLHQPIVPMILVLQPHGNLSIKIRGRNVQSSVSFIRATWQHYLPDTPFDFSFLDQRFDQLYHSEQQQGVLFTIFACIALFIACLGLFGLSAFTITQRVKEIGVRKVLGASIPQIVTQLSKDFLILVLIAAAVAIPVAIYTMGKWLQTFASRIEVSSWILVAAGGIALIIAFATISVHSIKAAMANPVKSLRSE